VLISLLHVSHRFVNDFLEIALDPACFDESFNVRAPHERPSPTWLERGQASLRDPEKKRAAR